jgi:hypothetical protein
LDISSIANYTFIYQTGLNISMKTLREMMDLIEAAQQPVAEGWTKLPSGDYQNSHTGVRSSKPPVKKKRGEKTGAEWDAIEKAKKDKEQGVAEGSLEEYGDTNKGQKMLGKVHHRAADRVTSKRADTDPAYARKAQQTQDRAWDRLAVKEQGVAEEQLEETTPEAIARIDKLAQQ